MTCSSNSIFFLLMSGWSDVSLCCNLIICRCSSHSMTWWITAELLRPSCIRSMTDHDIWRQLYVVVSVKLNIHRSIIFLYVYTWSTLRAFPRLSCPCRTISSGRGCSAVGQLCSGREGSGQRWGRKQLYVVTSFLTQDHFTSSWTAAACYRLWLTTCLLKMHSVLVWFVHYSQAKRAWNSNYPSPLNPEYIQSLDTSWSLFILKLVIITSYVNGGCAVQKWWISFDKKITLITSKCNFLFWLWQSKHWVLIEQVRHIFLLFSSTLQMMNGV